MKRLIKLIFIIIIVITIIYLASYYFKNKVGDLRPALVPQNIKISEKVNREKQGVFILPENQQIKVFAQDLDSPRDIAFSPDGTLFVSVPEKSSVYALLDDDNDGVADEQKVIVSDTRNPHGLEFYDDKLYVASEQKVVSYKWNKIGKNTFPDQTILVLPEGGRHKTRTIAIDFITNPEDPDLYISLGSTCDTCIENHPWISTIIKTNLKGENPKVYAKGLRNAVFIKLNPQSNKLWATEMGRDFLGDNLPPDEINIINEGGDYGWPFCYGNKIYDTKFGKNSPKYCEDTLSPAFEIQAHSAPLGLSFIDSDLFPDEQQGDLLVAYHGSWNRSEPAGYKVVRLEIENNRVVAEHDYLTGFLDGSRAIGRPVDVEFSPNGDLYISDDKAGVIYKISKKN